MRRFRPFVIALVISVSTATAALADTCGDLVGYARLQAFGDGTAKGTALVKFDGAVEVVPFESEIVGNVVHQTWYFTAGTVEVIEEPNAQPLAGPLQTIDSEVEVQQPNSGDWSYGGVFNGQSLRARFVVTGDLCFDS
jgi:hypothetical protein